MTARYHLEPLSQLETNLYIDHRLKIAGARTSIFDKLAKKEVFKYSTGVPRLINIICDRALLGAYSDDKAAVTKDIISKAYNEIQGIVKTSKRSIWPIIFGILVMILTIILLNNDDYLDIQNFLEMIKKLTGIEN